MGVPPQSQGFAAYWGCRSTVQQTANPQWHSLESDVQRSGPRPTSTQRSHCRGVSHDMTRLRKCRSRMLHATNSPPATPHKAPMTMKMGSSHM